jgi:hypothetical protein
MHRLAAAAAVLFCLSACGGGGGASIGAPGDGSVFLRFEDRVDALDAVAARLADAEFAATTPVSGSAVYRGRMGATVVLEGAADFVVAEVELTALFAGGTIGGTFSALASAGGEVSGAGVFDGGRFGASGIETSVAGTLGRNGTDHAIAGGFRGAFVGADAGGIVGGVEATLDRGGAASGRLDGEVWAER